MNYLQLLAKQKLYDAALQGDVRCLLDLLQQDALILDRYTLQNTGNFMQSPLHVAAKMGHLEFTTEILRRKPEMAEELDQVRKWSALHIASGKGHLEIVKALLAVNSDMCFACDTEGLNSVHVAAVRGEVHVLDELLKEVPQAARERTNAGVSVLHLCVRHCQIHALEFLINGVMDDIEMINAVDGDGNTILHLAVANKQIQIVKFLLENKKMNKNVINKYGLTAMDIHKQRKKETDYLELWVSLRKAKAETAKTVNEHKTWVQDQSGALMVVASLIATMAFQAGLNPPGGAWQDDDNGHKAGNSIMADVERADYHELLISSTFGFISSLSVIVLLISGLHWKKSFIVILIITMWISVTATANSYLVSVRYLSRDKESPWYNTDRFTYYAVSGSFKGWQVLMTLLLVLHGCRLFMKIFKRIFPQKVQTLWLKIAKVVAIVAIIGFCLWWIDIPMLS